MHRRHSARSMRARSSRAGRHNRDRRSARRSRARRARRAGSPRPAADRGRRRRARISADRPRRQRTRRRAAARGAMAAMSRLSQQSIRRFHGHLLWNSGDINSSASACWRDSARSMVCRVSGERRRRRPASSRSRGIDAVGEARGHLRGNIEPQLHAFGRRPGGVGVGKTVRAGRRPQRLAQQIEAAEIAAGIIRDPRQQPAARDQEFVRAAHLGQRRLPGLVGIHQRTPAP